MSLLASAKTSIDADDRGPQTARRFFHSSAVWDPTLKTVVLRDGGLNSMMRMNGLNGISVNGDTTTHPNGIADMDIDMAADGVSRAGSEWNDADAVIGVES